MEARGGISSCTCEPFRSRIAARGWFLGPPLDAIEVYLDDTKLIGQATLNQPRADIAAKYPEYDNPNSGWSIDTFCPHSVTSRAVVTARACAKGAVVRKLSRSIEFVTHIEENLNALWQLPNEVEFGGQPTLTPPHVAGELRRRNVRVVETRIDVDDYARWLDEVDYAKNYPGYVQKFPRGPVLSRKTSQHYLAARLLDLQAGQTYIDVASDLSVFPDIAETRYNVGTAYRQDLQYEPGVHGKTIGGDAAAIPLPDRSVDTMGLHCSWEHFEGDSDAGFLVEAGRLLKPGGRVCIIPLYMADVFAVYTSLGAWQEGAYGKAPAFDEDATLFIREEFKQRCSRAYSAQALCDKVLSRCSHLYDTAVYYFTNHLERPGCPIFALLATKR